MRNKNWPEKTTGVSLPFPSDFIRGKHLEHINALLISMKPLLEQYGYLALIVSIFFEGIGIPMPGQSLMIAASILASEQVMNLSMVMAISWLSCFLGNTCGYLLGYYFEGWLDKKGYISGPKMQKLQSTIQKIWPCLFGGQPIYWRDEAIYASGVWDSKNATQRVFTRQRTRCHHLGFGVQFTYAFCIWAPQRTQPFI